MSLLLFASGTISSIHDLKNLGTSSSSKLGMGDDPSNEAMEHLGEVMLKRLRSASRAVREVLHAEHVQTPINATLDQVSRLETSC